MLKKERGNYPELAYFTIEDQTLMTTDALNFTHADVVNAPDTDFIWQAVEKSFEDSWNFLNKGNVKCPGNGEKVQGRLENDRLIVEPPCRFCDYDVLCGNKFDGVSI